MGNNRFIRKESSNVPQGWKRIKTMTPGLIWMISSIGSGTILFTPRIGAKYGYELLWMAITVTVLIFIIIREIGRFTIVTGKSIMNGFKEIPGPANWGVWFLFIPQMIAGIITVSGLAALGGSALITTIQGDPIIFALTLIAGCLILIISGQYPIFELVSTYMAGILTFISIITAIRVISQWEAISNGLVPRIPDGFEIDFVLPWLGFFLAGAAGIIWYSYWVAAREYGGPILEDESIQTIKQDQTDENKERQTKLKDWVKTLNYTSLIGIIAGGLINVAFLILGAELLAPEGIIPQGVAVAEDLTLLLSEVWGEIGRWFLLISILIALLGSILSNQDGYGRMFSDTVMLLQKPKFTGTIQAVDKAFKSNFEDKFKKKRNISNLFRITITALFPALIYIWLQDPVEIMTIAGIISAIHIPFIVFGTIYLNSKVVPKNLQANLMSKTLFWASGIFYGLLGIYQILNLFGITLS
jgi:Mn2+/Fe2+ NRAMP family transporter